MTPAQYLAHYRAHYPDWFDAGDDDFPTAEDLWFGDEPELASNVLAGQMVEATGDAGWVRGERREQLSALIAECRKHYEPMNADWLARATSEGSRWRQVRHGSVGNAGKVESSQLWRPWAREANWLRDKVWLTFFAKPRVPEKARRRQDKRRLREGRPYIYKQATDGRVRRFGTLDGEIANFRSRPVGNWAFGPAYSLAASWWETTFNEAFDPNFEACLVENAQPGEKTYRNSDGRIPGELMPWVYDVKETSLNPAAWFWVFLSGRIDLLLDIENIAPDPTYWRRMIADNGLTHVLGRSLDNLERNRIMRIIGLIARAHRPDTE